MLKVAHGDYIVSLPIKIETSYDVDMNMGSIALKRENIEDTVA